MTPTTRPPMSKARAISRQRRLKATKFIRYLRRLALATLVSQLGDHPPDWWDAIAIGAGCNKPSTETIAVIQRRMTRLYGEGHA